MALSRHTSLHMLFCFLHLHTFRFGAFILFCKYYIVWKSIPLMNPSESQLFHVYDICIPLLFVSGLAYDLFKPLRYGEGLGLVVHDYTPSYTGGRARSIIF
jgi:hypothetical protein